MKNSQSKKNEKSNPEYQAPADFLRQLRYKNQKIKLKSQSFQKNISTMQQRGKGFRG